MKMLSLFVYVHRSTGTCHRKLRVSRKFRNSFCTRIMSLLRSVMLWREKSSGDHIIIGSAATPPFWAGPPFGSKFSEIEVCVMLRNLRKEIFNM